MVGGQSESAPSNKDAPPGGTAQLKWFSDRVQLATGGAALEITFTEEVRAAISPEITNCRDVREKAWRGTDPTLLKEIEGASFQKLAKEEDFSFDPSRFKLREEFATLIGIDASQLHTLHHDFKSDLGKKGQRREKGAMLSGLTDPESRKRFWDEYLRLLLEVVAPMVAHTAGVDRIHCQSFPCVRVNRPGEFSIGPHCDAKYGHPIASVNCYLPLTDIYGANSLFLESAPGREDWHPIAASYGSVKRFWGGACTHFTIGNCTEATRVSLDFRVLLPACVHMGNDQYTKDPGYYITLRREDAASPFQVEGELGVPDRRMGFPFK